MTRLARVVVAGAPHHVTQRGNRRQLTFFKEGDCGAYLGLMAAACAEHGLWVPAWCLMPNQIHLIVVPDGPQSLALAIRRAHWRTPPGTPSRLGRADKVYATGTPPPEPLH